MNDEKAVSRCVTLRSARSAAYAALTLLCSADISCAPATARAHDAADSVHGTADSCSRHPELFKVRRLTAIEAMRLVRIQAGVRNTAASAQGASIVGPCTRFIKTFANLITLTNNARFVMIDTALVPAPFAASANSPRPFLFTPPPNISEIAADGFAPGHALAFVESFPYGEHTRLVLWSNDKQSLVGTIRCIRDGTSSCALGHPILSSPYPIHEFGFIPAPDAESEVGSLWLWMTLRPDTEALVSYMIEKG
jgi:hypothetical protein